MARKIAGLSESDVADLRREVEAGKRPRVFATAASGIAAGTSGQVVAVGDAAEREFVVVRIAGDELPFAPEDLTRSRAGGATNRARRAVRPAARGATAGRPPSDRVPAAPTPAAAPAAAATPQPTAQSAEPARAAKPAQQQSAAGKPAKRTQRGQPSLAVTVRYTDGGWTVEAARGAKTVVKATPVRPGHALELVEQLQMPAVTELVADAVAAGRVEAERRASQLREQLAAAEAELADYQRRPRS